MSLNNDVLQFAIVSTERWAELIYVSALFILSSNDERINQTVSMYTVYSIDTKQRITSLLKCVGL